MTVPPPDSATIDIPEEISEITGASAKHPAQTSDFSGAYQLLRRLANRWTFPILGMLQREPMRFAKLKRSLEPVSQRMLTLSLRRLERDNLVYRQAVGGQPPQVTYGLTPFGVAMVARIKDFEAWLAARNLRPGPRN